MTEAEKYLNDFAGLQKEHGDVEITFDGLCRHLEMFAYQEQERFKKLDTERISENPSYCRNESKGLGRCISPSQCPECNGAYGLK